MNYTKIMERKTILLLFGGKSSEYEVALASARNIYEAIDQSRYQVTLANISKKGEWRIVDSIRDATEADTPLVIDLVRGKFCANGVAMDVDVVFPALHGKFGEDGTVQGLLDIVSVPYVGCGTEASALCMDKLRTKRLLAGAGIKVTQDIAINPINMKDDVSEAVAAMPGPWFVKPSRAGSSVGITKVKDITLLDDALREAWQHDSELLVESAVPSPRELEVAVMGNVPNVITSTVGEIIPGEEFYSYDDKYSQSSASQTIVGADLPKAVAEQVRTIAEQVYKLLNCRGLARVDFLLSDVGELYVNEVNTMPGFTNISMFPKLMMQSGLTYPQLIDKLITLALE